MIIHRFEGLRAQAPPPHSAARRTRDPDVGSFEIAADTLPGLANLCWLRLFFCIMESLRTFLAYATGAPLLLLLQLLESTRSGRRANPQSSRPGLNDLLP